MYNEDVLNAENEKTVLKESNQIQLVVNGNLTSVDTITISPFTTLNEYLRENLFLTGTKYMCLEGGCGACIIAATAKNPRTGSKETFVVNSCLVSLLSCDGWEITTVEGLGNHRDGYHDIQRKIVQFNATQCGFCTPGMVMNMYALQVTGKLKMAEIENAFGGNMCRCTGYRSILSAFKSMASDKDKDTVLGLVPDIEDVKLCKNDNTKACQNKCPFGMQKIEFPLKYVTGPEGKAWYKAANITNIFNIFKNNPNKSYQLVAGNTGKGVYKDISNKEYYIDIASIQKLKNYSWNTDNLLLGGNMTLTEVLAIFRMISQKDDGFVHLAKVADHIDLIANDSVRNIGTLAGNLSMKHIHNEFPSDIFMLLEVLGAKLVIENGKTKDKLSPKDFLDIDMAHKVITTIELLPLDKDLNRLETYKITPRLQNAHAHLNAGFLFKFQKGLKIVESASIVYGAVSSTFIHAVAAENYIVGKYLFDNANMQNLFSTLYEEVVPSNTPPDPSSNFRRQLSISLMYKFILSLADKDKVTKLYISGGEKLIRAPVSLGVQEYETKKSMYPIGQSIGKLEAADQAAGEAKYITDLIPNPGQLYAFFVTGQVAPGSILKSIDAQLALELDGVEGFYQAADIEDLGGVNSFMAPNSDAFYAEDEEIFLPIGQPIKYYNQPVGVIAACSKKLAELAASLVIVEFKGATTGPILTVQDALNHDTSRIHHIETHVAMISDTTPSVSTTGHFETNGKYHYHMELQVVDVVPNDDDCFNITAGTQWLDAVQYAITRSLKIPSHKLNICVKRLGGSFGAKITRNNYPACAATLVALKLHRPVKFFMSLQANMNIIGKRNPITSNYEVSADSDGVITSLKNSIYNDVGAFQNSHLELFLLEIYHNTYKSDFFETDTFWVRTDNPATTMMRAPMSVEGCSIIENIMEHVAYLVNKDPVDVRLANLNADKNPLLKKIMEDCITWSEYRSRRKSIEQFNEINRWRKKGIALIPMTFSLLFMSPYNVQVSIYQADGTVAISHCGVEMGQGINTKVAQVAAYIMGIDINLIRILPTNNFVAPNNFCTGGSVTTESACRALNIACTNLKSRIDDATTAAGLPPNIDWTLKVKNAFRMGVSLTENRHFANDPQDPTTYRIYGVSVAEIELDLLTGMHIIQRVDLMEDAGDSLNPVIDIGQCEGAFVLAAGGWTSEHIVINDHDGALLTNSTWTYKIPGARDIPVDFRVKLPSGNPNPLSPFKNKATSEPPTCLAFSVPLAIKHALKTARTQSNAKADPWAQMSGTCTVEWIFMQSLMDFKQYKL